MNEVAAKPVKNISAKHVPPSMKSSKLDDCVFILQVIAHKGPLEASKIMSEFLIKQSILKDSLELLVNQKLISKETGYSNKMIYDITKAGNNVLRFFKLDVAAKIHAAFEFQPDNQSIGGFFELRISFGIDDNQESASTLFVRDTNTQCGN